MKIKRMKKGKKLQVSNVSAPALLLLLDKKKKQNKKQNREQEKKQESLLQIFSFFLY